MILSYVNASNEGKRYQIHAKITTHHALSSYGQPVIILENGNLLELASWALMNYQVVKACKTEHELLEKWLSLLFLVTNQPKVSRTMRP